MKIGFRNANPRSGGESYYITIEDAVDDRRACLLVDSGEGVSVEDDLGDDEYLAGILLTHAHLDHYRTLGENVVDGASIHTSPSTAAMLETVYREGERNYDLVGTEAILDALDPIEGWREIRNDLAVHPVPAGHAPGAAGFVIRVLDGSRAVHALATGDFGFERVAGYPPLATEFPVDIDVLFVNGAIGDGSTTTDPVVTALERAREGSTVLVATGGLTGVEYAYLLGHAIERVGAEPPVTLVGQLAKLYDDLAFDVPNVDSVPTFDDPGAILEAGGICLAGPEVPVGGSTARLFGRIEDDPGATLLQIGSSGEPPVESAGCTVYSYRHGSHPPIEAIDDLVDSLVPVHTVVVHGNHERFKGRYDGTFTWTDTTSAIHTLYADGNWQEPPWIDEEVRTLVRKSYNRKRGARIGGLFDESALDHPELPTPGRERPDLEREGLALDALPSRTTALAASASDGRTVPDGAGGRSEGPSTREIGSTNDATTSDDSSPTDIERVLARLDGIEARLEGREPRSVRVRVVDAGGGDVLLRVLDETDLDHGEELSITLPT